MNTPLVSLRADEVHVWRARLELSDALLSRLYTTLSRDEKLKAARFKFHADRSHFIARRGLLRSLLAKYLRVTPAEVDLQRSEHGKPHLAEGQDSRIRFNLSASQGFAIYAVSLDREVGIDIERIDENFAWRDISKVFFTLCEQDIISRLPATKQSQAFFEIWTRKESILKAIGTGLRFNPSHINVAEDYALGRVTALRHDNRLWKLISLSANGIAATIAAPGGGWRVVPVVLEAPQSVQLKANPANHVAF